MVLFFACFFFFFFKQKTAYEMRISDWSSDVCSSDLDHPGDLGAVGGRGPGGGGAAAARLDRADRGDGAVGGVHGPALRHREGGQGVRAGDDPVVHRARRARTPRSEEHTSELQSLMRISYAVFCLNKKKNKLTITNAKLLSNIIYKYNTL